MSFRKWLNANVLMRLEPEIQEMQRQIEQYNKLIAQIRAEMSVAGIKHLRVRRFRRNTNVRLIQTKEHIYGTPIYHVQIKDEFFEVIQPEVGGIFKETGELYLHMFHMFTARKRQAEIVKRWYNLLMDDPKEFYMCSSCDNASFGPILTYPYYTNYLRCKDCNITTCEHCLRTCYLNTNSYLPYCIGCHRQI